MDNIKLEKSNYGKFILKGSLAVEHYYEMNDDNSDLLDDYNKIIIHNILITIKFINNTSSSYHIFITMINTFL